MFQSDRNRFSAVDRDGEMVVECFQIVHRGSRTVGEYFSTSYGDGDGCAMDEDRESVVECYMVQITLLLFMYVYTNTQGQHLLPVVMIAQLVVTEGSEQVHVFIINYNF